MNFVKYQGTGNDFVMIADLDDEIRLTSGWVRNVADRRFGIGADGVIRVAKGRDGADFFMDYVNSDGSVSEMCGNGIRCLALFVRAEGLVKKRKKELRIDTRSGRKMVWVQDDGQVRVDMGPPIFAPTAIPVVWDGADALHAKFDMDDEIVEAACLSMGNPHAVLFVDDPNVAPVTTRGPLLENHRSFPRKTNVEFVRVDSPGYLRMRVWERGSGETMACGTGACAAMVAARLLRAARGACVVALPGGDVGVEWAGSLTNQQSVYMTGPAEEVFRGEIDVPEGARG